MALTSCGLFGSNDGFTSYTTCVDQSLDDPCVQPLGISQDANRHEVTLVEETDTEIRIRIEGFGKDEGDDFKGVPSVELSEPVGGRAVIDDTSGESVPFIE